MEVDAEKEGAYEEASSLFRLLLSRAPSLASWSLLTRGLIDL